MVMVVLLTAMSVKSFYYYQYQVVRLVTINTQSQRALNLTTLLQGITDQCYRNGNSIK